MREYIPFFSLYYRSRMAKLTTLVLLCQILTLPILIGQTNGLNFEDVVSAYMEQYGSSNSAANGVPGLLNNLVGAMTEGNAGKEFASNLMSAFLQGDGAKNLGAMLGQDGGGAGNILAGTFELLITQIQAKWTTGKEIFLNIHN